MAQPDGFEILHDEPPCLVIHKPGGVLTQAPPGIDSLEVRIKRFLKARNAGDEPIYLGVPHRLDRPASGALVVATSRRATRKLCEQFESRQVEKTYWALVEGHVEPAHGTWNDFLHKVHGQPRAEVVDQDHPEGRLAVLQYRVIGRHAHGSWLEIQLETGRTHQIRIQAAHRGHPVLGDEMYAAQSFFGPQTDDLRQRWIALHARRLKFHHPTTHQSVDITAPLPSPWQSIELSEAFDSSSSDER